MNRAPAFVTGLVAILSFSISILIGAPLPAHADVNVVGQWTTLANSDDIRDLAMTGNLVWAGTHQGGVIRWDPFDGSFRQFLAPQTGLASNEVRAVASDGLYLVWFATARGVSQYEPGTDQWVTYTTADGLPSNNVTAVAYGPDQRLWVGTSQTWTGSEWVGGGLSIRQSDGSWVTYTVEDGLPSNNITDIAFAGGDVWIGTTPYKVFEEATATTPEHWVDIGGGVARLSGGQWSVFDRENSELPNDRINAVAAGNDGRVWFATPAGLAAYNPVEDTWRVYGRRDGMESNKVRDVAVDLDNRVWALTYESESTPVGALNRLEGDIWEYYDDEDGLSSKVLWAVLPDDQGRIWVGTGPWCKETSGCEGGGLTEFHPLDNTWEIYRMADSSLVSNQISAVTVADDGSLWIATHGTGLNRRDPNGNWQHFTMENSELPSNLVRAVAVDRQGAVWVGTQQYVEEGQWVGGGIGVYKDGTWQIYTKENSDLPANEILTIRMHPDGTVWIGTGDLRDNSGAGLAVLNPETNEWTLFTVEDGLPSNLVADIAFDATGDTVWVATGPYLLGGATGGGVARWANGVWTSFTADNSDIPTWHGDGVTGDFRAIVVDTNGNPWAGTWNSPVHPSQIEPYFDAVVAYLENETWSATTFPQQGRITSLVFDRAGNLWAGIGQDGRGDQPTRGGLRVRMNGVWTAATVMTSGLAGNDITTLAVDAADNLWIGTANAGLSYLQNPQPGPSPTPTSTPTQTPVATQTPTVTLEPTATQDIGQTQEPTTTPQPIQTEPVVNVTITPLPVTPTPGTFAAPPEVPEATTLVLVGSGLAALGSYAAYRWRKRHPRP